MMAYSWANRHHQDQQEHQERRQGEQGGHPGEAAPVRPDQQLEEGHEVGHRDRRVHLPASKWGKLGQLVETDSACHQIR